MSQNYVSFIGRLTKDFENHSVGDNETHTVFKNSIAVDRPYSKNKETDFFNIEVWGNVGKNLAKYTEKGYLVKVDGYMKTFKKDEKVYYTVVVKDFYLLPNKQGYGTKQDEKPMNFNDEIKF